jgi:hypothetical protein
MSETGGSFGGQAKRGAGGTPGGVGEFAFGLILAGIGTYLLFNQVQVHTSFWRFGGLANSFGISLIPMLLGVAMLFFNGKSKIGWVLSVGGFLFIVVGILMNMDIYFQRTSLFNTMVMLVLLAGGLGLIFKSLRPH